MANSKITALTADTAPASTDVTVTVDDTVGTPVTKKVTWANVAASPAFANAFPQVVTPEFYGAVGNGTTDDSAAITSWLTAISTGEKIGQALGRTYRLASTVVVPVMVGATVRGVGCIDQAGNGAATVFKADSNVTAFRFAAGAGDSVGSHGCLFEDFSVEWASASGTGNTTQVAFSFKDTTAADPSYFQNTFRRISSRNAYSMFLTGGNAGQQTCVWGSTFEDIKAFHLQHALFAFDPPTIIGQPANTFRDIAVHNQNGSVVSNGDLILLASPEAQIIGLDVEGWNGRVLAAYGGGFVNMSNVHIEHHTVTSGVTTTQLLYMANGPLHVRGMTVAGTSTGGTTGWTAIAQSDTGAVVEIEDLSVNMDISAGSFNLFYGTAGLYRYKGVTNTGDAMSTPSSDSAVVLRSTNTAASLRARKKKRTSGSVVCNSTSWANLDTGLDLTIPAAVNDFIVVYADGVWLNEAVQANLDAVTLVSGSPVNSLTMDGSPSANGSGVWSWRGINGAQDDIGGGIGYVVVAGDLVSDEVTIRFRYRTSTATNKTLYCPDADNPFTVWVVNHGQKAA